MVFVGICFGGFSEICRNVWNVLDFGREDW